MGAKTAEKAKSWPGPVLISHEILGISEPDHIARIAETLAPSNLHVIVMARCLADLLPSAYQEKVKQVNPHESWPEFLKHAQPDGNDHWCKISAPSSGCGFRTVPPRGTPSHVLLDRFTSVVQVDPAEFVLDGIDVNTSLDAVDDSLELCSQG